MAIAYDTASSVSGNSVSSVTIPAFSTSGSNRLCFVGAALAVWAKNGTVSSIVRGGTEIFTSDWGIEQQSDYYYSTGRHYVAPGTGSASVVVTCDKTVSHIVAGAISLTGVDQTTPTGTAGYAEGSTSPYTVTVTAADDEWLADVVLAERNGITVGSDQTQRWKIEDFGGSHSGGGSTQPGTADDVMSWTASGGSGTDTYVIGAVPIKPVGAVSGPLRLPLLGVGP